MKVAIISSVFYPEYSKTKYDLIVKVLNNIPDYAGVDYDLFIINDGTEDPRFDNFMKTYKPDGFCKNVYYGSRENKGISKSLNELLSQIDDSYDYICHLDLDTLVPVHWLKKCISVLNHRDLIGLCGVLVEDELSFDIHNGIQMTEDGVLFCHVPSIGGACMVFRASELKSYGWDEDLVSDHIDAYIITRYRKDGKHTYSILDRGYHPKHLYESEDYIKMKIDRFEQQLPNFYNVIKKY
jgi:cellulose synthase/poly-beta-1,6-N-acetylglucosamine synthase-like glycosyltransferase